MKRLFKEVLVFFILLAILAVLQHQDFLTEPIIRWDRLMSGENRMSHPFEYTAIIYVLIGIIRLIISFISSFFELSKKKK